MPPRQIDQPQRIVEVAVGEQPGVGGDAAAVELQLQAAVEIDPQGPVVRFTRRVFHGAATEDAASCWKADQISLIRASTMPAIRGIRAKAVGGARSGELKAPLVL